MNSMEAEKIAKPIVKAIVDCTADKKYQDLSLYKKFKQGESL